MYGAKILNSNQKSMNEAFFPTKNGFSGLEFGIFKRI
jgi:hypothetical protein